MPAGVTRACWTSSQWTRVRDVGGGDVGRMSSAVCTVKQEAGDLPDTDQKCGTDKETLGNIDERTLVAFYR